MTTTSISSRTDQPDTGQADWQMLADITVWLRSFITKPHPTLGRKGVVCPFAEQALKLGRVSLSTIDVSGPRGEVRLTAIARSALERLGERDENDNMYNTFLMIPVGAERSICQERVVNVHRKLKPEAVAAGKLVGDFFPNHPMPGIHSEDFRPLASPHPMLAARALVITDILFLTFPTIPAAERLSFMRVWHSLFGEGCPEQWARVYETAWAEAEIELADE